MPRQLGSPLSANHKIQRCHRSVTIITVNCWSWRSSYLYVTQEKYNRDDYIQTKHSNATNAFGRSAENLLQYCEQKLIRDGSISVLFMSDAREVRSSRQHRTGGWL